MQKPNNVPAEAWFHEEWQEWILGQKEGDKCLGEWKQWHKTEGHLTCIMIYDSKAMLKSVTRFHADGTFSKKEPYLSGKLHGIAKYQGSKKLTTENVLANTSHPSIFKFEIYYNHGIAIGIKQWTKEDIEINTNGIVKPATIPQEAMADGDGNWFTTITNDHKSRNEKYTKIWNEEGKLLAQKEYDSIKNVQKIFCMILMVK